MNELLDELESNSNVHWRELAACRGLDPNLFFPIFEENEEDAKKICRDCIAQLACLEYALQNRINHGVWGGTGEQERRRIRRQRSSIARKELES